MMNRKSNVQSLNTTYNTQKTMGGPGKLIANKNSTSHITPSNSKKTPFGSINKNNNHLSIQRNMTYGVGRSYGNMSQVKPLVKEATSPMPKYTLKIESLDHAVDDGTPKF